MIDALVSGCGGRGDRVITGKQLVEEYKKTIGKYTYSQRDCIGSIWKILEKYGAKTDVVGSNWFARHELKNMRPLTDKSQLYDGCAVLKTKLKGEVGYNLPPKYQSDDDLIDYNHIGIGTDEGEIYDSTRYTDSAGNYIRNGPGLSTAKIGPNSWDIIADFEDVDYSDRGLVPDYTLPEVIPMELATVYAPSGSTVRLRKDPSSKTIAIANVPVGTAVGVLEKRGAWWQITHAGKTGWMMAEFLHQANASADPYPPGDSISIIIPRSAAQALFDSLKGVV